MSEPNYQYCKEYCSGHIKGCPHYEQNHKFFDDCKHYKLLQKHASHILNFTEKDLSELEKIARNN